MILLKLQPDHNKITWLRVYDYELSPSRDGGALIRLGFPPAPALQSLNLARNRNSQAHSTKGTPSPPCGGSDLLWAHGFRFCFTPLTGVLFNFPSRYLCTIGLGIVFSLRPWSAQIPTGFHVARSTWDTFRVPQDFIYETFTLYGLLFQAILLSAIFHIGSPATPASAAGG